MTIVERSTQPCFHSAFGRAREGGRSLVVTWNPKAREDHAFLTFSSKLVPGRWASGLGKEGRTCIFQRSPAAASLLYAQCNPPWRCGVPAAQSAALEAARILTCSPRSGKPRTSSDSQTATEPAEPGGLPQSSRTRPQFQDPPTVSEPTNLRPGSGPAHFCTKSGLIGC